MLQTTDVRAAAKALVVHTERMLLVVAAKYGNDSHEYEMPAVRANVRVRARYEKRHSYTCTITTGRYYNGRGVLHYAPTIMHTPTALDTLLAVRQSWREHARIVVFTNGVFDLLHIGHLRYLEAARALGDVLVVGLNSDASVRQIKGPQRPLVGQNDRAALLLGLRPVDYVTIFEESTAEQLVAALQPDVYVKGGDYRLGDTAHGTKPLPEAAIVHGYGGRVELIPYVAGHSTTELIERITKRYG